MSNRLNKIDEYHFQLRFSEQGNVVAVGDGIVWVEGLPSAAVDELLFLEDGSKAMVSYLIENLIGAILLEETDQLTSGTLVYHSGLYLSTPVGDELLGRVIDPFGVPLDGKSSPTCEKRRLIDVKSPPIIDRDFVNKPLYTGNKILDCLIPIGKGQRQLIIGDAGLGKSSIAIDTVINQKDKNVRCIYVLIGQKRINTLTTIQTLTASGAMEYTTIVVAEATNLPGLQYLAPFAGCAIAEEWMFLGYDTLIIYDDLTKHAECYRELSLLLRRPPGREAFPADIFFLHSRLLERSTCLASRLGGGSMTALPIIETKEGEIAAYIPTNLISITDGQIYFDAKLFVAGFFPAIDITKSVSRIGGKAQTEQIKNESARIKLDYLQFLELEAFTHFGTKLEASMQKKIQRGRILRELLKQDQLAPLPIEAEMAWLVAYNDGLFDEISPDEISQHFAALIQLVQQNQLKLTDSREKWHNIFAHDKTI
ncbi:MAG: F0F1 ATP synthase subunit alpha [Gammaproteobacteria bacterium]|nr:F0F1 ATP synthase subunit alpha [Gammaproteobacteria bacterium]